MKVRRIDNLCCGTVYDVANRETFEALPKWFSEIDTYVSITVPKIIVGNKVDKVLASHIFTYLLFSGRQSFSSTYPHYYYHQPLAYCSSSHTLPISSFVSYQPLTPFQENSRQVSTNEGSTFASRQNALFVEASAKTAIGVRDVFEELVARILETPELWAPVAPEAGVSFGKRGEEDSMPGTIDVRRDATAQDDGVCGC